MRIVSLISSGTEIVCALGLLDKLVGISHECDYPPEIKSLPQLSHPKIKIEASSRSIDEEVKYLVSQGLSIYGIDTGKLAALKPDLIITQDQCEVCAVSLKDVEKAVCHLTTKSTAIVSLRPYVLDDICKDFRKVGKACSVESAAEDLVTDFWIRLNQINARAGTLKGRPKIACIEWIDPLIISGGWTPEIVRLAGGEPVIVSEAAPFKKVTWDEINAADPDIIAIFPCGYPISKTMEELEPGPALDSLKTMRAYQSGNCFVCDGNAYFNRPGPRITDSCEILATLLHPDTFGDFQKKHQNSIVRLSR